MKRLPGTNFRVFPDGTLAAPKTGGIPPKAPEGYEPAPWDPWMFLPALVPCEYRTKKKPKDSCCGRSPQLFCNYVNDSITRPDCMKCQATPEDYWSLDE